ncbi:MAG: RNA polymerase sigma factor [Chloroflexi bacterium]|nr:RNA polymerase sigma factor [Chloroflexota bacterium]
MNPDRQAELVARFEGLFDRYHKPILNYLYRLLGDAANAEEVAQDVFVKAYNALAGLPDGANDRAWLYRIATNTAYDLLRRRKLIEWLPLLDRDSLNVPDRDLQRAVGEREAVQNALNKLPLKYRVPLVLYGVQGYSVAEVAEMMGLSEGTVKTRLYRARERFREVYGGDV